jgi:hypothetical protein
MTLPLKDKLLRLEIEPISFVLFEVSELSNGFWNGSNLIVVNDKYF